MRVLPATKVSVAAVPPRLGRQRGQSSAETALALPAVVLLVLGLLQLGSVLWLRVQLQAAAQAAGRAYTVWMPISESEAQDHAAKAALMALRPRPPGLRLDLWYRPGQESDSVAPWARGTETQAPPVHQLDLEARFKLPGPLGSQWDLRASASILAEKTAEDQAGED